MNVRFRKLLKTIIKRYFSHTFIILISFIYENYENDFLNTKILQKPTKELIGEELFNWI